MSEQIASWALALGKRVLTTSILWFEQILDATGLTGVWMGIIIVFAVFSILLVPLRGGFDLSQGALGSFIMGRVNRRKSTDSDD